MNQTLCASTRFAGLRRFLRAEFHPLVLAQLLYIPVWLITGRWEVYALLWGAEWAHQILHEMNLKNVHPDGTPLGSNADTYMPVTIAVAAVGFLGPIIRADALTVMLHSAIAVVLVGGAYLYSRSLHARRHKEPTFISWWWTVLGIIITLSGALAFRLWT